MKVAVTQAVRWSEMTKRHEDTLDPNWLSVLPNLGMEPVVLSNPQEDQGIKQTLEQCQVDGVLLTGGNDLWVTQGNDCCWWRDRFESRLLTFAIDLQMPVLGVCRGMQLINDYLGGSLIAVENHVQASQAVVLHDGQKKWVNSYHHWGINDASVANDLVVWARSSDGLIKGVRHAEQAIMGIMWHPERTHKDQLWSWQLMQDFYHG